MKAVLCTKYGPPEVLVLADVPKPSIKQNQVLIKIFATAVNSGDVRVRGLVVPGLLKYVMMLVLGITKPRKPILGTVFSGEVVEVGERVNDYKVGDEVYGMTGFQFGTYAEYIAVKASGAISRKPSKATHQQAAALPFGGTTALYFLEKAGIAKLKNPKVLIYGSTGAVGSSAVQIAKHFDAHVTAVCSTEGVKLTQSLGADKIIDYTKQDFTATQEKFDIIFDAVGKTSKKLCSPLLREGGVFITVAALDTALETKQQLELLAELYNNGELQPVIDRVYLLAEIVEAHRYVDSGKKKGNVVIKVV